LSVKTEIAIAAQLRASILKQAAAKLSFLTAATAISLIAAEAEGQPRRGRLTLSQELMVTNRARFPRGALLKSWPTEQEQEPMDARTEVAPTETADPYARFAKDQLKAFVERIERLEEEKAAITDDIRDIYAEAKSNGYDVKALRTVVKLRKQDVNERKEQEAILETYLHALGMLG
jgi:uncharacterized protein (UPF0335 family)